VDPARPDQERKETPLLASLSRASSRPLARLVLAGLVLALLASCRPMNSSETHLFVATNDLRREHGLPELAQQEALVDQARQWAAALAAKGALEHSDPYSWNVQWTAVAENVGTSSTMDDIVARLEASDAHRNNMLSTKYTHMAVGTTRGKDGRLYAVQLFWRG
jgi:uncharacterized protein YkwD